MKRARIIAAFAGAAALALLTWRLGVKDILTQLSKAGVALPIILAASAIRVFLQTRAWKTALSADGIHIPQTRLVFARLASQAAGYLAVLGPVVSEPAKLVFLQNPGGMAAAAPATFVETGTYWLVTVALGLAGTCGAVLLTSDARAVWAAAAVFGAALAFLAPRRSLLSPVVRAAGSRAPKWLRAAEDIEGRIRSFRCRHPRAASKVLAFDSLAQTLTLVEVAAVLWAVGARTSFLAVLVIEAAARLVKILGAWIPGRVGADEGGAAASFALLGFAPEAGLALAVSRRVRDLLFCSVGVAWAARRGGAAAARKDTWKRSAGLSAQREIECRL